jgi:hypothetical protein
LLRNAASARYAAESEQDGNGYNVEKQSTTRLIALLRVGRIAAFGRRSKKENVSAADVVNCVIIVLCAVGNLL